MRFVISDGVIMSPEEYIVLIYGVGNVYWPDNKYEWEEMMQIALDSRPGSEFWEHDMGDAPLLCCEEHTVDDMECVATGYLDDPWTCAVCGKTNLDEKVRAWSCL